MRYLLLLLLIAGCTTSSAQLHTEREFKIDGAGNPHYREVTGDATSASAPGATSQPTTSSATRDGAGSSASGRQVAAPLPAFVYGLEQRQYIFYGTGVLLVLAALWFVTHAQPQKAGWCFVGALTLFMAETFIQDYAPWVVLGLLLSGVGYVISRWVHRSHTTDVLVNSAENLASVGEATAAAAVLRATPSGRKRAK